MRLTRAALRAGAQDVDNETTDASKPHIDVTDDQDRLPLGEVSANTAPDHKTTDVPTRKMSVKKSKAAKKGAKGKKAKAAQEEEQKGEQEEQKEEQKEKQKEEQKEEQREEEPDVVPEEGGQVVGGPANDAVGDNLADEPTADTALAPVIDEQPSAPPSPPVRMTRRQLAKQEEDSLRSLRSRGPPQPKPVEEDTTAGAQEPDAPELPEQHEQASESLDTEQQKDQTPTPEEMPVEEPGEDLVQETQKETVTSPPSEEPMEGDMQEHEPLVAAADVDLQDAQIHEPVSEKEAKAPVATTVEFPETETAIPSVEMVEPEPKVLASEKPIDGEVTPAASLTPSRTMSRSSTRSPSKTPMRLEESIGAIDALEEALEDVGRSLPSFDQLAAEKSPRKAKFTRTATPSKAPRKMAERPSVAPVASKVSQKPSLAPRSAKTTGLSRASSVRAPPKERSGSGEVTDYLASKRRPISMTFAAPPPLAKSNKAPTMSTFQLPGEIKAAELKARKEERLKRMAESGPAKPRPISMPPPPKSSKPPTKSDFVLPGELKAAELKARKEERLKRMAEGEATTSRQVNLPPPPKSTKPPTVPNFQLPGEKLAAEQKARREERLQREAEEAEPAKKSAFKARPAPKRNSLIMPVRQTATSQARLASKDHGSGPTIPSLQRPASVVDNKRKSIIQARSASTSSSTRNSVVLGPAKIAPVDAATLKAKGREVFNRDKLEKESRDKERREKEEAAKKARAEAAERGRIASREWAKKQMERKEEAARKAREGLV